MVPARPRLGQLLVEAGIISPEQLAAALRAQQLDRRRLGALLVEAGALNEIQLTQVLSQQLNAPWVSLYHIDFSRHLLNLIPREIAEQFCLIPIYVRNVRGQGNTLYVAMDDPTNELALKACAAAARLPARAMIAPPSDIRNALRVYYGVGSVPEIRSAPVSLPEIDAELLGEEDEAAAPHEVLGEEDEVREPPPREPSLAHIEIVVEPPPPPPPPVSRPPSVPPPPPPVSRPPGPPSKPPPPVSAPPPPPVTSPPPVSAPPPPPVASPPPVSAPPPPAASAALAPPSPAEGLPLETDLPFAGLEVMPPSTPTANRPAPKTINVTLLDGTTITLPARPQRGHRRPRSAARPEAAPAPPSPEASAPEASASPAPAPPSSGPPSETPPSDPSEQLTARDLIAALRAVSHGADASEILGDNAGWEALFAALLSLLLKKQVIADWEFVEEYKKI